MRHVIRLTVFATASFLTFGGCESHQTKVDRASERVRPIGSAVSKGLLCRISTKSPNPQSRNVETKRNKWTMNGSASERNAPNK